MARVREILGRELVSARRACQVLGQPRATQRRQRVVLNDAPRLVERMVELATRYGRYGYRRITILLRRDAGESTTSESNGCGGRKA